MVPRMRIPLFLRRAGVLVAALLLAGCRDGTGTQPNPTPGITALNPETVTQRSGPFTLAVNGSDFVQGSVVRWNGADRPTTYVSATQLTAAIPASDVEQAGVVQVSVFNPAPGGGASGAMPLEVRVAQNPAPVITGITPAALIAGTGGEITIRGTGFLPTSAVYLGNQQLQASYLSPTELRVTVTGAQVATGGEVRVVVVNPAHGGGVSPQATLLVNNPLPVAASLTPATTPAGQDSVVVRVTGSGFTPASVISISGGSRTTRFLSATQLETTLSADDVSGAGTHTVSVFNPGPGGGRSENLSLTLTVPQPVLTLLPSYGAHAARPGYALRVHGSGFLRSSVVRWNGVDRPTNYISRNRLEIAVTAADVAAPGTASITVHTPGGGTSQAAQLTVRAVPAATRTSLRTLNVPAVDMVYDAHSARLYVSLGAQTPRLNRILAIDPLTGAVTDSVIVGGDPGSLAVSDDGRTLWVELAATHQILPVSLPSLTPGVPFSTDGHYVAEIHPLPGSPGTIAVALENPWSSPRYRGVAVYDHGVRRAQTAASHIGSNSISWGEDETVIYGADGETSERGFRTLRVDASGVRETRMTGGMTWAYSRIRYASGRVYTNAGAVIDASRHQQVGSVPAGGMVLYPDAALGRLFYVSDGLFTAYDMNTFQTLGSFSVGGMFGEHPANARPRLVRWAPDGLAYRVDDTIVIFRSPLAGP